MSKYKNMRIVDIANKLAFKENTYILGRIHEWVEKSEEYADMMIEQYGFNSTQKTRKGYQVLFLMNKVCPNLHHYKNRPNFVPWDKDSQKEYNKMQMERMLENTQVGMRDIDGALIQDGVYYTDEEYDVFIEIVERIIDEKECCGKRVI